MKIYGLKNCDSCRKAKKALGAELHDVRDQPLSIEQLQRFYDAFGKVLLNTRSTTWRGLDDEERKEEPLALLQKYPALMKRPVIEKGNELLAGWDRDVLARLRG